MPMPNKPSYLAAAFNAKPLGMPLAPNWIGLAALALLGAFVSPGFWLIGAGLEIAYLWLVSRNGRFRALVDAGQREGSADPYAAAFQRLEPASRRRQKQIEERCAEIIGRLKQNGALQIQLNGLSQLAWLHLKLLAAHQSLSLVVEGARAEHNEITAQQEALTRRLAQDNLDEALRRSLEQQQAVVRSRLDAHRDAAQRLELVNAELERVGQQIALVHEQALLAADAEGFTQSLDVLAASLNQASVLFADQQEVMHSIEDITAARPPESLALALEKSTGGKSRQRLKEEP